MIIITVINQFLQNPRGKKTFNAFFVSHADQMTQETLKYGVQKTRLKSAMAEQVANEEEEENARKRPMNGNDCEEGPNRRTRTSKMKEITVIDDNQNSEQDDDHDHKNNDDDKKGSIWEEWNPERHNVIWCGKLVQRRHCLPPELYDKLNQEIPLVTIQDIKPCFAELSMAIFDAESNIKMQSCIELLNCVVLDDQILVAEKKLIVDICRTLNDYIFDDCGLELLQKSESCYRSYLFDNCMKITTKYLRSVNHNVTFFPGEIELDAMTIQIKQKGIMDRRYKYNADGKLIANDFSATEILLTEVSSSYGSNDTGKISFDHYKAMFGMLAMIRTVALLYDKASFNTFTKLKIHFLHAHGNSIRHWSMSTQAPGIYIMTKEQRVNVPISFSEKDITVYPFICFFKTLAIACEETLSVLKELKQEHKAILRSKDKRPRNLCSIINPTIIRLNERKHTSIVAEHGPMSPMHG
ncbi:unnamed protein product [Rhizopus stolonifer]